MSSVVVVCEEYHVVVSEEKKEETFDQNHKHESTASKLLVSFLSHQDKVIDLANTVN